MPSLIDLIEFNQIKSWFDLIQIKSNLEMVIWFDLIDFSEGGDLIWFDLIDFFRGRDLIWFDLIERAWFDSNQSNKNVINTNMNKYKISPYLSN